MKKRKLVYLPSSHSKDVVEEINGYFDNEYEIEKTLDVDGGYYIVLVLNDNVIPNNIIPNYKYNYNYNSLIEE